MSEETLMNAIANAAETAGIDPDIAQKVAEAESRQPTTLRNMPGLRQGNALGDFERLLATGERLLRHQQERASQHESEYQKARTAIVDGARVRMDRIRLETEEELRQLDLRYFAEREGFERTIMALKGLRGE